MSEYAEKKIWVNINRKRVEIFKSFDKAVKDYEKHSGCIMYEIDISEMYNNYPNRFIPFRIVKVSKSDIYKRLYEMLREATDIKKSSKSKGKKGD